MPRYASKARASAYKKKGHSKKYPKRLTVATVKAVAKKAVKQLAPRREIRFHEYGTLNTGTFAASWQQLPLTNISLGTQDNQRSGDKIYITGVRFMLAVRNAGAVARSFRLLILKNLNRNADLLDTVGLDNLFTAEDEQDRQSDGLIGDIINPINSNYKVFLNRSFVVEPETVGRSLIYKKYCPLKQLVRYDNLGTNNTTVSSGVIRALVKLEEFQSVGSGALMQFEAFYQVFFRDA